MTFHIPSKDTYQIRPWMRSVFVTQVSLESLRYNHWKLNLTSAGTGANWEPVERAVWGWASTESNCGTQGAAFMPFKCYWKSLPQSGFIVHEYDPIFLGGGKYLNNNKSMVILHCLGWGCVSKCWRALCRAVNLKYTGGCVLFKTAREWTCLYTCEMEIYPCKYYDSHC